MMEDQIIEDWFTLAPKYRTKKRLVGYLAVVRQEEKERISGKVARFTVKSIHQSKPIDYELALHDVLALINEN